MRDLWFCAGCAVSTAFFAAHHYVVGFEPMPTGGVVAALLIIAVIGLAAAWLTTPSRR